MNITQLLNNNCFPGRNGLKPKYVILHGTAGGTSAQEIAQFFKGTEGGSNPVSAHYVVDEQGIIYQCNLESDGAWANGVVTAGHDPWWNENGNPNPNNVTISIEHVKPDDANATQLTSAQQAASFALVKDICQRNNIPMRVADANGGITGHFSIDPINRARCPGTFNYGNLWSYLANGGNTMTIPTGWTDDGTTLKAPDGTPVHLGFRDHVLANNWDPANIPLEAEQHLPILEQSNPGLGSGQRQIFRLESLEYTPKMGVFEGWIGQELLWYQKQHALLQAQNTTLQAEIVTLQALPVVANMEQIRTIGQTIKDDVDLVIKLAQVQ